MDVSDTESASAPLAAAAAAGTPDDNSQEVAESPLANTDQGDLKDFYCRY